jgi:hypothetical protein
LVTLSQFGIGIDRDYDRRRKEQGLNPLGRLLVLVKAVVVAALVAASPAAVLGHTIHGNPGHSCDLPGAASLCQPSDHNDHPSTTIGFVFVEETSDQFEDSATALGGTHHLYRAASFLDVALRASSPHVRGDHRGPANPATGPPINS